MVASVAALMERAHGFRVHGQQAGAFPEDGASIGVVRAALLQQLLQNQLIRLIGVLGHLLQHHLPLQAEGLLLQGRVQNQIQQQIKGLLARLGRDQNVEMHVIKAGGGIAAAAKGLDGQIKGTSLQPLTALEHHVFQEVRHPFLSSSLREASGSTPEVKAGERSFGHLGCHAAHTVGEGPMVQCRTVQQAGQNCVAKFHSVPPGLMQSPSSESSSTVAPLIPSLAETIRGAWIGLPELKPLDADSDFSSIEGQLEGDDLLIRNELLCCRGVRKIHLELARLGRGLQILHCVWFPDPRFDLPIFGADIVAGPAGVSAAIVDLSPVSGTLPSGIETALAGTPSPAFRQVRDLPGWGTIFSPHVCFIRPDGAEEEVLFRSRVEEILTILRTAVLQTACEPATAASTIRRYEGQLSYCLQQKRNDKTRRVLEKAFDASWADRYIEELLFDDPLPPS